MKNMTKDLKYVYNIEENKITIDSKKSRWIQMKLMGHGNL
jgi:hypothetical protein